MRPTFKTTYVCCCSPWRLGAVHQVVDFLMWKTSFWAITPFAPTRITPSGRFGASRGPFPLSLDFNRPSPAFRKGAPCQASEYRRSERACAPAGLVQRLVDPVFSTVSSRGRWSILVGNSLGVASESQSCAVLRRLWRGNITHRQHLDACPMRRSHLSSSSSNFADSGLDLGSM